MIYGYMINNADANAAAARLSAAGCKKPLRDNWDASESGRAKRDRLISQLTAGDELVVVRLSHLASSTLDLLRIMSVIAEKKAVLRSLDEPWADLAARNVKALSVLEGIVAFERDVRSARTEAGQARAVARGVKLGRKPKLTEKQEKEARRRRAKGETLAAIAETFNVSHSTISRLAA